jgi:hypothetical protein
VSIFRKNDSPAMPHSFNFLLATIANNESDEAWLNGLKQFCGLNSEATSSSLSCDSKSQLLALLQAKLNSNRTTHLQANPEC